MKAIRKRLIRLALRWLREDYESISGFAEADRMIREMNETLEGMK